MLRIEAEPPANVLDERPRLESARHARRRHVLVALRLSRGIRRFITLREGRVIPRVLRRLLQTSRLFGAEAPREARARARARPRKAPSRPSPRSRAATRRCAARRARATPATAAPTRRRARPSRGTRGHAPPPSAAAPRASSASDAKRRGSAAVSSAPTTRPSASWFAPARAPRVRPARRRARAARHERLQVGSRRPRFSRACARHARRELARCTSSASARIVNGSENPKNSGPLMRVRVLMLSHTAVHGFVVGDGPTNVRRFGRS